MVKFNENSNERMGVNKVRLLFLVFNALCLMFLNQLDLAEARDRGDDIIMTKGKLIMRGGKGMGNLILDTGSSKGISEHVMPMMPMHFNPYAFYPMQHDQQPMMMKIQPVFVEDHSAMHQQPEQHHEYHSHVGPQHQYYQQHHEMHHEQHHEMHQEPKHHEPEHHQEPEHQHHEIMHNHEPEHYHQPEMHHYESRHHHHETYHHEPEQHHEHHEHHHEPIMGHYGGGHEDEKGHHMGYETHPMISMMVHGSDLQPSYQQFAALQGFQPSGVVYGPQQQHLLNTGHSSIYPESTAQQGGAEMQQQDRLQSQQQEGNSGEVKSAASNKESGQQHQPLQQAKVASSLLKSSSTNPLMAIIKPLLDFKRNQQGATEQNKKPQS